MADDDTVLRQKWAAAYAAQSESDFQVYRNFRPETEECHRLHYLQMACEKIAKAYRLRDMQVSLSETNSSHVAFSKFIENLLTSPQIRLRFSGHDDQLRNLARRARIIAREIEKMAPAVDRESFPENAEYPWVEGKEVVIPCRYSYPKLVLLKDADGRRFLKIIQAAIEDFSTIHLT